MCCRYMQTVMHDYANRHQSDRIWCMFIELFGIKFVVNMHRRFKKVLPFVVKSTFG